MTAHPFDTVPLPSPSRGFKDTCGVCGGLMKDHPEAPEVTLRRLVVAMRENYCAYTCPLNAPHEATCVDAQSVIQEEPIS